MLNGSLWTKCPVKLFICSKIRPVPFTSGASMSQRTALHVYHASYTFPSFTTMTCYSLFHVLWSTWTRFIWYRSSSAQTSLNNYRILSKPRYYVNSDILVKLYYALIYPFLTYGLISWGDTYSSTTQPLFILQKRAMRMMTFSKFREHSSPIFKRLNIVKLPDLVFLNIAVFMFKGSVKSDLVKDY